jgi:hypothetical protein
MEFTHAAMALVFLPPLPFPLSKRCVAFRLSIIDKAKTDKPKKAKKSFLVRNAWQWIPSPLPSLSVSVCKVS